MKRTKFIWLIVFIILLLTGCANEGDDNSAVYMPGSTIPTPTITVTPPELFGLWVSGENSDALLTVSESSVYLVERLSEANIRELFFEIKSIDWENDVVTMSLKWIRNNGMSMGFDYPLRYMKVKISKDNLFYSFGDEGQGIPQEAIIGPFIRK